MCSLTTEPLVPPARAKPHRGVRIRGLSSSVVLALALAACDPIVTAGDASVVLDAARFEDAEEGTTDAASGDAGPPEDARPIVDAGSSTSLVEGDYAILFVGNSYVYTGDVPSRSAALASPRMLRVHSVAPGGYRLIQHATDAETDGTPLAMHLRGGTAADRAFDVVLLQEQSQIGGFPETQPDRVESLDGARRLASLARGNASSVVLFLTWGREHGDETNPGLYPSFEAMQDRLDAGYRAMAARLREDGTRVRIAPVGAAFRVVHDDLVASGMDPEAEGSAFDALYSADGSHQSANGAYLAALVIHATITGEDPIGFADATDLDASTSSALRDVARRVMADPDWTDEL